MKSLCLTFFVFIILGSRNANAEYEQVVKPVRAAEVFNFVQYQFRQAMIQFFKNASSPMALSPTQVTLETSITCENFQFNGGRSELSIVRAPIVEESNGLSIKESLVLKTCDRRIELFSIERFGIAIAPTPDTSLIRGIIPNVENSVFYRIYLIDRTIKIEIAKDHSQQKMDLEIFLNEDKNKLQIEFLESLPDQGLTRQFLRFIFKQDGLETENIDSEYIWNLDPKNSVPRQYLFIRQTETKAEDFLKFKSSLFTQSLFPILQTQIKF